MVHAFISSATIFFFLSTKNSTLDLGADIVNINRDGSRAQGTHCLSGTCWAPSTVRRPGWKGPRETASDRPGLGVLGVSLRRNLWAGSSRTDTDICSKDVRRGHVCWVSSRLRASHLYSMLQ